MAGVQMTNNPIFGANDTQFAGVAAANINVQRDGIPVTGGRWPTGLDATTEVNPDLVGEVRMILAPVDAEMGRGSGQVADSDQIRNKRIPRRRSLECQNTALDAKTWSDNRTGATPPWRNMPNFPAASAARSSGTGHISSPCMTSSGPGRARHYTALSLTPCAQRGIFRYYDNWNSANGTAFTAPTWAQPITLGATPTIPIVDAPRQPEGPHDEPDGTPHNGILRYASVYGPLLNTPTQPDCSDAQVVRVRPEMHFAPRRIRPAIVESYSRRCLQSITTISATA